MKSPVPSRNNSNNINNINNNNNNNNNNNTVSGKLDRYMGVGKKKVNMNCDDCFLFAAHKGAVHSV